jgi:alpha-1,3-rhamnosyl/mannosyltransferase
MGLREQGRRLLHRSFRAACRQGRFTLYHETNFIPLPSDLPTVTTIHDLSALLHPEWHPADRVAHFEEHFLPSLSRSLHFLAISEAGRQEIIRHLGLRPDQVSRTYMGIRAGLRPLSPEEVVGVLRRLRLAPDYLLYVGTIEPRKNVLTLLRAYAGLSAGLRRRHPLVLAGGWGWGVAEVADFLARLGPDGGVIHLGYVRDEDLPALYNGARALAFPSRYEGFGLPPVEMLACGGAVLASRAEAVVETVGAQAHLIDADDEDGWRDALLRVLTDRDWWRLLRDGGPEVAQRYRWESCAEQTLAVYRRLTASAGRIAA